VVQRGDADTGPVVQRGDTDSVPVVQRGHADSVPVVQRGHADPVPVVQRGHADTDAGPVVERGQAQVIVHLDATTGTARLQGGPEIPASTAERLACDARVQALLDDRDGNRLHLSRARRLATPSQIAALTARDREKCQFPGCTHSRHLHAHHVRHWLRGGPTDIDNLILVCSFHHRVIHDHGYTIRRLSGRWEFRRPDGTPLPTTEAPLTGRAEALIEANTRAELRIDQASLTPTWYGERLDLEPILDALLPRRITTAA
jgi:hypothetical protein